MGDPQRAPSKCSDTNSEGKNQNNSANAIDSRQKKKKEKKKKEKKKKTKKRRGESQPNQFVQEASNLPPLEDPEGSTRPNMVKPILSEQVDLPKRLEQHRQKQELKKPRFTTTIPPKGSHPFEVDDSDHCETPLQAYQDLRVILDRLLLPPKSQGGSQEPKCHHPKPRSSLRIYDPYYCDGGVKTKLASMGFTNVINENRDFYKDIASGKIPDHDVLVTNPPYSGHHMEKLLEFCASNPKPSFLLLPHFVYTKDYYKRALSSSHRSPSSFFCFFVPKIRYSYVPPSWVVNREGASKALSRGKDTTAPFPSFWYCCHLERTTISHAWLEQTLGPSGAVRSKHGTLRYARTTVEIPLEFKGEFDPTKKRPNPRARKRMRKAAFAAANKSGTTLPTVHHPPNRSRDPSKKKKRRY